MDLIRSILLKTLVLNISKSAVSNSLIFLVNNFESWSNRDEILVVESQGVQEI